MKYIVMECHPGYAVVLDEEGRFLKVANMHYQVGQTVTDVIEMQTAPPAAKRSVRWIYTLTAAAACLVLAFTSLLRIEQMTYASVYMTINPEVRIDVNRGDTVVGLEGINPDGSDLIADYEYRKKDLDLVMDELVDRAIDMDYLHKGGQVSLVLDASSSEWIVSHSDTLSVHLSEHLKEKLPVTVAVTDKTGGNEPIVIPVMPEESDYGESDYSDYEDAGQSDYADSVYGESDYAESGQSDYADSVYGESDYAESGQSDSGYDDGQTDYGAAEDESDYEYVSDGELSNYDESSGDDDSDYDSDEEDDDDDDEENDDDDDEEDDD